MFGLIRAAVVLFVLLSVLTGLVYPLVVTGMAQVVFPFRANGSVVVPDQRPVGSELIGQTFQSARYFWSRPSATGPVSYNAAASSGSNAGPTNPALREAVEKRVQTLRAADPAHQDKVPVDLVTTSASGLDPHISPAAARYQVPRVAKARDLAEAAVRDLVDQHIEHRSLGLLGEPRVNVLELNLAVDRLDDHDRHLRNY